MSKTRDNHIELTKEEFSSLQSIEVHLDGAPIEPQEWAKINYFANDPDYKKSRKRVSKKYRNQSESNRDKRHYQCLGKVINAARLRKKFQDTKKERFDTNLVIYDFPKNGLAVIKLTHPENYDVHYFDSNAKPNFQANIGTFIAILNEFKRLLDKKILIFNDSKKNPCTSFYIFKALKNNTEGNTESFSLETVEKYKAQAHNFEYATKGNVANGLTIKLEKQVNNENNKKPLV